MTTESKKSPPTEIYKTARAQIEHYDNAINQCVIWLSIGQSFLLAYMPHW